MDIQESIVSYAVDAGYFDARSDLEQTSALEQVCLDVEANSLHLTGGYLSFEQARTLVHRVL